MRSSVLFPEPFGPVTVQTWPAATSKSIPPKTRRVPKRWPTCSRRMLKSGCGEASRRTREDPGRKVDSDSSACISTSCDRRKGEMLRLFCAFGPSGTLLDYTMFPSGFAETQVRLSVLLGRIGLTKRVRTC